MEPKRILVLCGGKFVFPALQQLGIEGFLCGIGIGKGDVETVNTLKQESANNGFAFKSFPDKMNLVEMRAWLDELKPDCIFSISFPFLISTEILAYGPKKFINFHPGPLPNYRGPMPIFEVLRYQEKTTAISVHFMNEMFDEGALILKETIPINHQETYGSLAVKLSERTAMVALNIAQMLQFGSGISSIEQPSETARYFEKPESSDTFVRWKHMPSTEILALINACNPWNQGADTVLMGNAVKLINATLSEKTHDVAPGTILPFDPEKGLSVACMDSKVIDIHIIGGDHGILTAEHFLNLKSIIGHYFN